MTLWQSLMTACRLARAPLADDDNAAVDTVKLIVGLGNFGSQYMGTRHNVGFDVIDRLVEKLGPVPFRHQFEGQLASIKKGPEKILLLKPETYMNLSGRSVQAALSFYKLSAENLLVICDDFNLPVGKIRIRKGGSDGGQKGLRSLAQHVGTTEYPRLRLGIGAAPPGVDASQYVLSRFHRDERPLIDDAIDRAVEAVLLWREAGIESCMNRYN